MTIIGITGHPSSGKDTAAEYIASRGFTHVSLGDVLREEMKKVSLPVDRPSIRQFAATQRQKIGAFYPVDLILSRLTDRTVVTGFRNLAEVNYIKERFPAGLTLLAVEAPLQARYERAVARNREGDNISFTDFQAHEEAERNANPESHEVDIVIAQADHLLENSGSLEDLYQKVDKVLEKLK